MSNLRTPRPRTSLFTAMAVVALALGVLASPASAAVRHFDGTVVSKNTGAQTFRVVKENGKKRTIEVTGATTFERIQGGIAGLKRGMRVSITARTSSHGLVAKKVERNGTGGGGHGGGNDDPPNHG